MFPIKDKTLGITKYAGRSKATVVDNKDPKKKGRIRVQHPILGLTGWIPYLKTNSVFDPPEPGDIVFVELDCGVANYPVAWGNQTKRIDDGPSLLQEEFQRNVPTNRGMVTPRGNALELDDGSAPNSGDSAQQGIRLTTIAGNKLNLSDDGSKINIQDVAGNSVELSYGEGGIIGVTINSTKNVHIVAQNDVTVEATGKATVTASEIDLNGSAGEVLTTVTDPVVDLIYGTPTMGVPTVKAG